MRTITAGLVTTVTAGALGVGAMQGAALAAPSSPSPGDAGIAAGKSLTDFLDVLRSKADSNTASNTSTPGATY